MADGTWTGVSSNYTDGGNWNPGVPGGSDTATFDLTGVNRVVALPTVTSSVGGWTFNGGDYTIAFLGGTFTFGSTGIQVNDGSATILLVAGADVVFSGNSDGGNARYIVNASSTIEFPTLGPNGDGAVSMGSLEGGGNVLIGSADTLSVGGDNLNTYFNGTFTKSGSAGSLIKTGPSTMTLAGTGSFLNSMTINAGGLTLSNSGNDINSILVEGGHLTLSSGGNQIVGITIADGTVDLSAADAEGGASISLNPLSDSAIPQLFIHLADLSGGHFATSVSLVGTGSNEAIFVPFIWHSDATVQYDFANQKLVLTDSANTLTFDSFHAAPGERFALIRESPSNTLILPAIVATAPHAIVDATHSPPGQHASTNAFDMIVALGLDETIKGLGGLDILVGGAPGVELFGGAGADTFKFQKIGVSPSTNPDVIMDFRHAQGDTIDLTDLHFSVPGGHDLVFIGGATFAGYHQHHPGVLGMVRYAGGLVQVNVDTHLTTVEFEISMHGAPALSAPDFQLV